MDDEDEAERPVDAAPEEPEVVQVVEREMAIYRELYQSRPGYVRSK